MKNTILVGIAALIAVFVSGCVFIAGDTPCNVNPCKEFNKVGGGFEIFYKAPEDGTAVLTDKKSGKIIRTVSLNRYETFEFISKALDEKAYKEMGVDIKKANFVLYFYPAQKKPPIPAQQPQPPLPPAPPVPPQPAQP